MEDKIKETEVDNTIDGKITNITMPSDVLKKIIYEAVYKAIRGEQL